MLIGEQATTFAARSARQRFPLPAGELNWRPPSEVPPHRPWADQTAKIAKPLGTPLGVNRPLG